jgi:hypothetical protein
MLTPPKIEVMPFANGGGQAQKERRYDANVEGDSYPTPTPREAGQQSFA